MSRKKLTYVPVDNLFETSDLGLASFLQTKDFLLISLDKTNPRRAIFSFTESEELQDAVSYYWSSPERKYFDNIRLLKNRLYSA